MLESLFRKKEKATKKQEVKKTVPVDKNVLIKKTLKNIVKLTDSDIQNIIPYCELMTIDRGDAIKSDLFAVLVKGQIKIRKYDEKEAKNFNSPIINNRVFLGERTHYSLTASDEPLSIVAINFSEIEKLSDIEFQKILNKLLYRVIIDLDYEMYEPEGDKTKSIPLELRAKNFFTGKIKENNSSLKMQREHYFLHDLNDKQFQELAKTVELFQVEPNVQLLEEGDRTKYFLFITEGSAIIKPHDDEEDEENIIVLEPGQIIGERTITGKQRTANVLSGKKGITYLKFYDKFMVSSDPVFVKIILKEVAKSYVEKTNKMEQLKNQRLRMEKENEVFFKQLHAVENSLFNLRRYYEIEQQKSGDTYILTIFKKLKLCKFSINVHKLIVELNDKVTSFNEDLNRLDEILKSVEKDKERCTVRFDRVNKESKITLELISQIRDEKLLKEKERLREIERNK
ncbi:MAG: cyclic nucleotide-binding domain-containing protein [Nitrospinae bacterium]|nr:cyclic nucleotide-binding domain-containing protein [Nitrospinota bacterium]